MVSMLMISLIISVFIIYKVFSAILSQSHLTWAIPCQQLLVTYLPKQMGTTHMCTLPSHEILSLPEWPSNLLNICSGVFNNTLIFYAALLQGKVQKWARQVIQNYSLPLSNSPISLSNRVGYNGNLFTQFFLIATLECKKRSRGKKKVYF